MTKEITVNYSIFKPYKNLVAFTTTKQFSAGVKVKFTGDSEEIYLENRKKLSDYLGIDSANLIFPRQTHTDCVAVIDDIPEKEIQNTDALLTTKKGICICVQTADCVPIFLFDTANHVISIVHAGWRGTVKRIVVNTVLQMVKKHKSNPCNILAAIGPSIGWQNYQVGKEVLQAAKSAIPNYDKTLHTNSNGETFFDLWEANRQLLLESGVQDKNIEILGECSYEKNDKYFSARREGKTGRMVSGMMLKDI